MEIRDAAARDAEAMAAIVNREIRESTATWTTEERSPADMEAWIAERRAQGYPALVAEAGGRVVGYAGCGPFRSFPGYRLTAEHSVYVSPEAQGLGAGRALMAAVEAAARARGLHALVGGVGSENTASLAFHRALGFTEAGRLPEVGRKFDRWLTLILMHKLLV
ncbi:GNAT family N-acetyltransferase [Oceanicella sp. SM1341]|uniref:GNAT family N-acetyltransferase n=1 Tax=Oceanicella sp. SM1341 TaxID=1548889 RepID=UPI000E49B818|nr:GNAT family N-acetyltransferase [Oceanicella sp. SM1341]